MSYVLEKRHKAENSGGQLNNNLKFEQGVKILDKLIRIKQTLKVIKIQIRQYTLQSLYYPSHYNTVLVITRSGLVSQMVIFL